MLGHTITSAPLIVKDKVVVGVTGGEFGPRGFLDAYDAATGKQLWRFYSVPAPGEFGNDTWKGDSWKLGGSPMWLTGSLRSGSQHAVIGRSAIPARRSIAPFAEMATTSSAIPSSRSIPTPASANGTYQFTPNDGHDWDSTEDRHSGRSRVARTESQTAAPCRSQCDVLRAGPDDRKVSAGHTVRRIRTGTTASTKTAVRRSFRARTPARRAVSSCIPRSSAERISRRLPTVPSPDGSIWSIRRTASGMRARRSRTSPAVSTSAARRRGGANVPGPNDPPALGRNQGARSGNRQDGVGFQNQSGIAEQRSDGDSRRRSLRRDSRRRI